MSECADRLLADVIVAAADRLGGLESPDGVTPVDVLRRELVAFDRDAQVDVLTLVAGRAVLGLVAGGMVAAVRDGTTLAERIYGIANVSEDSSMAEEKRRPMVETRHRDGYDEPCVGNGWPSAPPCTRRPVVTVNGGAHRCRECFEVWVGMHRRSG